MATVFDPAPLLNAIAELKQANGDAVTLIANLQAQIAAFKDPDLSVLDGATIDVAQQAQVLASVVSAAKISSLPSVLTVGP